MNFADTAGTASARTHTPPHRYTTPAHLDWGQRPCCHTCGEERSHRLHQPTNR